MNATAITAMTGGLPPLVTLSYEEARELAVRSVKDAGDDHVGPGYYFKNGTTAPGCLVGAMFAQVGLTLTDLHRRGHRNTSGLAELLSRRTVVATDDRCRRFLSHLQHRNDQGLDWLTVVDQSLAAVGDSLENTSYFDPEPIETPAVFELITPDELAEAMIGLTAMFGPQPSPASPATPACMTKEEKILTPA